MPHRAMPGRVPACGAQPGGVLHPALCRHLPRCCGGATQSSSCSRTPTALLSTSGKPRTTAPTRAGAHPRPRQCGWHHRLRVDGGRPGQRSGLRDRRQGSVHFTRRGSREHLGATCTSRSITAAVAVRLQLCSARHCRAHRLRWQPFPATTPKPPGGDGPGVGRPPGERTCRPAKPEFDEARAVGDLGLSVPHAYVSRGALIGALDNLGTCACRLERLPARGVGADGTTLLRTTSPTAPSPPRPSMAPPALTETQTISAARGCERHPCAPPRQQRHPSAERPLSIRGRALRARAHRYLLARRGWCAWRGAGRFCRLGEAFVSWTGVHPQRVRTD